MEKKFKHKVTGQIGYYKDGLFKQNRCVMQIGVEPSKEYWEEIVDRDYEILSVIAYAVCNKDLRYWDIKSVKRLSDGEIFSIGDEVGTPGFSFPIAEFKMCTEENTIVVSSYSNFGSDGRYNTRLKDVKKVRKPIFVTEDGVELYEGDKYYVIYTWSVEGLFTVGKHPEDYIHPNIKYFAEKANAEEYVRLNEPKYSLKDVEYALSGKLFNSGVVIKDIILTILEVSKN